MTGYEETTAAAREAGEDIGRNFSANASMGDVINRRYSRRVFLKGSLAVAAISSTVSSDALLAAEELRQAETSRFEFQELTNSADETHHIAEGYDARILLRWGDKVFQDSPEFDPHRQSREAQVRQFGYNNDYIGFLPINGARDRGILVVNHEYTNAELMFPGFADVVDGEVQIGEYTEELVAIEIAAHGGTVIEIRSDDGQWRPVLESSYNRRITAETEMTLTGPVAGHERVRTNVDPSGTSVSGTLNNCAGGVTPWGTYLMAEENFHSHFIGELKKGHREADNYERIGVPGWFYHWGKFHDRFDVAKEPNEANRFGWIVEVDPFDPKSTPKKRTALGRFKHEGCETVVNRDGRVVAYSGDDERFEYVYKFVTAGKFDAQNIEANKDLLDTGTLYVARFNDDGTMDWLPLVHGEGPLTQINGFAGQADVLIETRRAADLLGATKMDRPEDVQPARSGGKVFVMLSNNNRRSQAYVDAANPRADNIFGHIIEITETDGDFASLKSRWEILLKCGDPSVAEVGATFSPATSRHGWFGMPDNCAIDSDGRLWVATDGNSAKVTGRTDGLWAVDTEGAARGTSKLFFQAPLGAELCGPYFAPQGETLFLAVQHPAEGGNSTYEKPATRWPDFSADMPPRPSVVVVTKKGGGKIG
ncbi:PhoX family phosphatase [Agrobacterium tumefaciens]|uniref:PhoX family protein n=1 Tax=Agrobacterium tumefaciens TaxID=358 RepID=UPI001573DA52|nr:PhoX family phosphatase [Agrobacterium tumefaciens]